MLRSLNKKSNDFVEWAEQARPLQALTTTLVMFGHAPSGFFTDRLRQARALPGIKKKGGSRGATPLF